MTDNINPWKYVKPRDVSNNPYFKEASKEENKPPETTSESSESTSIINAMYTHLPQANTYALGVEALELYFKKNPSTNHPQHVFRDGSKIFRPLSFKENIEARINEYNRDKNMDNSPRTDAQRLELFDNWIDSCTGIAYKKSTSNIIKNNLTYFKIIPVCENLININVTHNSASLPISYSQMPGNELNSGNGLYNQDLTLQQVLTHPAWLSAVEGDKKILEDYAKITFKLLKSKYKKEAGMRFYIINKPDADQLRVLYVDDVDDDSLANGDINLNGGARFLLVAPLQKK
jgi:hypothetical protein